MAEDTCVVCLDSPASVLQVECRHQNCCVTCAFQIFATDRRCPTCRTKMLFPPQSAASPPRQQADSAATQALSCAAEALECDSGDAQSVVQALCGGAHLFPKPLWPRWFRSLVNACESCDPPRIAKDAVQDLVAAGKLPGDFIEAVCLHRFIFVGISARGDDPVDLLLGPDAPTDPEDLATNLVGVAARGDVQNSPERASAVLGRIENLIGQGCLSAGCLSAAFSAAFVIWESSPIHSFPRITDAALTALTENSSSQLRRAALLLLTRILDNPQQSILATSKGALNKITGFIQSVSDPGVQSLGLVAISRALTSSGVPNEATAAVLSRACVAALRAHPQSNEVVCAAFSNLQLIGRGGSAYRRIANSIGAVDACISALEHLEDCHEAVHWFCTVVEILAQDSSGQQAALRGGVVDILCAEAMSTTCPSMRQEACSAIEVVTRALRPGGDAKIASHLAMDLLRSEEQNAPTKHALLRILGSALSAGAFPDDMPLTTATTVAETMGEHPMDVDLQQAGCTSILLCAERSGPEFAEHAEEHGITTAVAVAAPMHTDNTRLRSLARRITAALSRTAGGSCA